jgi:hypothetical protein
MVLCNYTTENNAYELILHLDMCFLTYNSHKYDGTLYAF